jgi:ATP-dependent RNA circularization protein (DNA/RNA ligase family)
MSSWKNRPNVAQKYGLPTSIIFEKCPKEKIAQVKEYLHEN